MSNTNDPFDDALAESEERWISERTGARQERWEERVIKRLVQAHVGAPAAASILREMREEVRERTGEPRLLFDSFVAVYPRFPVWIVSKTIPYAHDHVSYGEMQAKKEHWFRRLYAESMSSVPETWGDKPVGIVFEMLNVNAQFNILHNANLVLPEEVVGTRYSMPKRKGIGPLHLEPLDLFMCAIAWSATDQ